MTKKHFIALADHIRDATITTGGISRPLFDRDQLDVLAHFCKEQNSQFDRERWLDYIAGKCGKNGGTIK